MVVVAVVVRFKVVVHFNIKKTRFFVLVLSPTTLDDTCVYWCVVSVLSVVYFTFSESSEVLMWLLSACFVVVVATVASKSLR